jgi:hypothetical protein
MRFITFVFTALLAAALSCAYGQKSIRINNSYFLSGQPLFGIGYLHETDDRLSFGATIEGGRYAYHGSHFSNTVTTDYSVQGLAVLPELRWYVREKAEENRLLNGLFVSGFAHMRAMTEYVAEGNLRTAQRRRGNSIGGGFALGYRTACGELPFYVEALAGYGRARALWNQTLELTEGRRRAGNFDTTTTLYRLELILGFSL